jgi:hypothetical protein
MATGSVVTWSFSPGLSGLKVRFAYQRSVKEKSYSIYLRLWIGAWQDFLN